MKRREFIAGLGGAVAWPLTVRAQRQSKSVIGFLSGAAPNTELTSPFLAGLGETGYTEGQDVTIEYRWAEGHYDRLPALAADLVDRAVNVIAASPSQAARAAKAATTKIPIVFSGGVDPIQAGLVARLNRPGGNLTGSSYFTVLLTAKRYELLLEMAPKLAVTGLLVNPTSPNAEYETKEILTTAGALSRKVRILRASTESEIDSAFATIVQEGVRALLLGNDAFFFLHRSKLAELAVRHAIPAIYPLREYAIVGGLISYGADMNDSTRQMGVYVGRVLRGEKPADLPVQQPTKFEFVINLKTAKALGLTIPPNLLALADEVIE
jgi:putative tryptophan/tyrosine transport system substrate-binding protein